MYGVLPGQIRSKRDAGSAVGALAGDRRKRATTMFPSGLVKFTKNRPLVAASGANAIPSRPSSPPYLMAGGRRSRNVVSTPLSSMRIRPPCSTMKNREAEVGSGTKATGAESPCATTCARSCAAAGRATRASKRMDHRPTTNRRRMRSSLGGVEPDCAVHRNEARRRQRAASSAVRSASKRRSASRTPSSTASGVSQVSGSSDSARSIHCAVCASSKPCS